MKKVIWKKGENREVECPNSNCSYLLKWRKRRKWRLRKPLRERWIVCEFCNTKITERNLKQTKKLVGG